MKRHIRTLIGISEKAFSWNETGKINMAYECIDRHVDNGKGDKIALNYRDENVKNNIVLMS